MVASGHDIPLTTPNSAGSVGRSLADQRDGRFAKSLCDDGYLDWVNRALAGMVQGAARGVLAEMASHHFRQPGKMLRSQFVQKLGRCYKLPAKATLDWAVACELLHNATLIHDDLQDGDEVRRGAKAVWAKFGSAQAINFGDFLLTLAPKPVLLGSYPEAIKLELISTITDMSAAIANGQVAELELGRVVDTTALVSQYLSCAAGKTSALFSGLAAGVAAIAGRGRQEQRLLTELFTPLGQIFQIQDDILDIYGDKGRGEIGCDIKEGKVSFLVACHLSNHPADAHAIRPVLALPRAETSDEMVAQIKALFDSKDTLGYAFSQLSIRVAAVESALADLADPDLAELVQQLIEAIFKPIGHLHPAPKLNVTAFSNCACQGGGG